MNDKQFNKETKGLGDRDGLYDIQGIMRFRAMHDKPNPYEEFERRVLADEAAKAAKIAAEKAKSH